MSCTNKDCRCCHPKSNSDEFQDWLKRQDVPAHVRADEVLYFKYKSHPSKYGRAMWSPDNRKWCGFWPDGTQLTGVDEHTGEERRWWWDTKTEVLAVIREAMAEPEGEQT